MVLHLLKVFLESILSHELLGSLVRWKRSVVSSQENFSLSVGAQFLRLLRSLIEKFSEVSVGCAVVGLFSEGPVKEFSVADAIFGQY